MSESDSDLDFESADEDTTFDVDTKSTSPKEIVVVDVSKDTSPKPVETEKIESPPSETCKQDFSDSSKTHQNLDNKQSAENDNTNTVNSETKSTAIIYSESKAPEASLPIKHEEPHNAPDISSNVNIKSEVPQNRVHQEKQRVTLRLEKKIQQKQQMSKDNSVEKEAITSTPSEKSLIKEEPKSSWGFGSWGTNLLSTAASSVSTFTNQVSQGIGTVLETVETTLGVPPPEELASTLNDEKDTENSPIEKAAEDENLLESDVNSSKPSILPDVSSWTKVLENTGSKVLMGGLDTLELIGKKTIDIITEGDPGLRKKRAAFSDGITLSQILREAKAEADESKQEDSEGKETVHYSQMFDEFQGLIHLEALEMLSKQSEMKIQRILMRIPRNSEIRKNIEEIKSICENIPQLEDTTDYEDFEDFVTVCKKCVLELNVTFNMENIIKAQKRIVDVLKNYEDATATTSTPEEVYHSAICSLAEFTAKSIEVFHKLAELILVQPSLEPSVEHFATNLTGLTTVMCIEINNLSSRYHRCLESISEQYENDSSEKSNITVVVTNLYLEAGNSNKYIQDAFLLLVPVLQASMLE